MAFSELKYNDPRVQISDQGQAMLKYSLPRNTPLIFLDIDGVVNIHILETDIAQKIDIGVEDTGFSKQAIQHLNHIIAATNAKLVISSTWRLRASISELQELFTALGCQGEVVGRTPRLYVEEEERNTLLQRGQEILWWLHKYNMSYSPFVVLDDDSDMLGVEDNFVLVEGIHEGLSESTAEAALGVLQRNDHIKRILTKLGLFWRKDSSRSFGSILKELIVSLKTTGAGDYYYLEDDHIESLLDRFI